jgi:hypothetical protein
MICMPGPPQPGTIASGPEGSVVWSERLSGPQLRLVDDPLVAILCVFDTIEQVAAFDGEQTLDRVVAGWDMSLQPVRHQMDRLTDLELVMRHEGPRGVTGATR